MQHSKKLQNWLFCENHSKMCTQVIEYTDIIVRYFSTGSFAGASPMVDMIYRVTYPGPGSPEKIWKLKLPFFRGRV